CCSLSRPPRRERVGHPKPARSQGRSRCDEPWQPPQRDWTRDQALQPSPRLDASVVPVIREGPRGSSLGCYPGPHVPAGRPNSSPRPQTASTPRITRISNGVDSQGGHREWSGSQRQPPPLANGENGKDPLTFSDNGQPTTDN